MGEHNAEQKHFYQMGYDHGFREGQPKANEVLTDRLAKAVPPLKVVCNGDLVDCPTKARIAELERQLQILTNDRNNFIVECNEAREEAVSLVSEVKRLKQEINYYWTRAVNETVQERDQAREEAAGHKQSLACALERNLKLAEECGGLEREAGRLRDLLNDIYPSIAGLVIAAQKTGEKNAERVWNDYCKRILEATEGGDQI